MSRRTGGADGGRASGEEEEVDWEFGDARGMELGLSVSDKSKMDMLSGERGGWLPGRKILSEIIGFDGCFSLLPQIDSS